MRYFAAVCPAYHEADLDLLLKDAVPGSAVKAPIEKPDGRVYVVAVGELKEPVHPVSINLFALPGGKVYELSDAAYRDLVDHVRRL